MEYRGYTARVEFDQDAGLLHGEVEGLRDVITFEATNVADLESAFRDSVNDYLEQCAEDGVEPERPYSGKFLVRVDPRLHREVAMAAARAGKSLNALMSDVFNYWIARERQEHVVRERAVPNVRAESDRKVPVFDAPAAAPSVVARSQHRAHLWGSSDAPASITPSTQNTPGASRTPQAKQSKRKVA